MECKVKNQGKNTPLFPSRGNIGMFNQINNERRQQQSFGSIMAPVIGNQYDETLIFENYFQEILTALKRIVNNREVSMTLHKNKIIVAI